MANIVPICCFCLKVRDDKDREAGNGPWVELNTYAMSPQFPLSRGYRFSYGYCPDCVAHFDERTANQHPSPVWGIA